ncbi:MAG TPA: hypothetical protein DEP24_00670 [Mycobacterium sp.]|nr:hypothetical protein [Mycobacterium sp.]
MTESTALSTTTQQGNALAFLHDAAAFNQLWRVAKAFSLSGMVPPAYQNKPDACLVALMYAEQLGEPAMLIFQEMAPINGRPSTSARFAIARANRSGLLTGPLTWTSKGTGETLEVTASATLYETGETITAMVSMREAKADGWDRNPKYRSMPEQMLRWRSATRLINLYIPQVLFGMGVREEAEVQKVQVAETPASSGDTIADLNRQIAGQAAVPAPAVAPAVLEAEVVTEPETQPRRRRAAAPEPVAEPVPQEPQDDGYDLPESPFGGDE